MIANFSVGEKRGSLLANFSRGIRGFGLAQQGLKLARHSDADPGPVCHGPTSDTYNFGRFYVVDQNKDGYLDEPPALAFVWHDENRSAALKLRDMRQAARDLGVKGLKGVALAPASCFLSDLNEARIAARGGNVWDAEDALRELINRASDISLIPWGQIGSIHSSAYSNRISIAWKGIKGVLAGRRAKELKFADWWSYDSEEVDKALSDLKHWLAEYRSKFGRAHPVARRMTPAFKKAVEREAKLQACRRVASDAVWAARDENESLESALSEYHTRRCAGVARIPPEAALYAQRAQMRVDSNMGLVAETVWEGDWGRGFVYEVESRLAFSQKLLTEAEGIAAQDDARRGAYEVYFDRAQAMQFMKLLSGRLIEAHFREAGYVLPCSELIGHLQGAEEAALLADIPFDQERALDIINGVMGSRCPPESLNPGEARGASNPPPADAVVDRAIAGAKSCGLGALFPPYCAAKGLVSLSGRRWK